MLGESEQLQFGIEPCEYVVDMWERQKFIKYELVKLRGGVSFCLGLNKDFIEYSWSDIDAKQHLDANTKVMMRENKIFIFLGKKNSETLSTVFIVTFL